MAARHDETPAGAAARGSEEVAHAVSHHDATTEAARTSIRAEVVLRDDVAESAILYDRMCEAIAHCEETLRAELNKLTVEEQLRTCARIIARNYALERKVCEIRLRAEHYLSVLLRDAAGLPPKNKRDAKWLARFCE